MPIELIDPDGILDSGIRLERLRKGMEVEFLHPTFDWGSDIRQARRYRLEVGRVYRVARFEIHDYHTRLWLDGFDDTAWFNSAQFEEAESCP